MHSLLSALACLSISAMCLNVFATMNDDNQTLVLMAYVTSEGARPWGGFECRRGYAQGCAASAVVMWANTYDILLTMQSTLRVNGGASRVVGGEEGGCDRLAVGFADDACALYLWWAPRELATPECGAEARSGISVFRLCMHHVQRDDGSCAAHLSSPRAGADGPARCAAGDWRLGPVDMQSESLGVPVAYYSEVRQ